jgi:hypothetical protein
MVEYTIVYSMTLCVVTAQFVVMCHNYCQYTIVFSCSSPRHLVYFLVNYDKNTVVFSYTLCFIAQLLASCLANYGEYTIVFSSGKL